MESPGIDGKVILKLIFRKWDWIELAEDRGSCECGNELSVSIK